MATAILMQTGTAAASTDHLPKYQSYQVRSTIVKPTLRPGRCAQLSATRLTRNLRRNTVIRASANRASGERGPEDATLAPLKLETPIGQFLVGLLVNHPHLFDAAAEQQLQQLIAQKEAAKAEEPKSNGSEIVLYRRIAEVKERERHAAMVELMYALVVQKFVSVGVTMVPKVPTLKPGQKVDNYWDSKEDLLKSVHSPEVREICTLRFRALLSGLNIPFVSGPKMEELVLLQPNRLMMGQVYASTVLMAYFLRRLEQRRQLEEGIGDTTEAAVAGAPMERPKTIAGVSEEMDFKADPESEELAAEFVQVASILNGYRHAGSMLPPGKLRSFVLSLDNDTVKRLTTMSNESLEVVQLQTQAVFGKLTQQEAPDGSIRLLVDGKPPLDDTFAISLAGFKRLYLEAFAFGGFLWEAESYMDTLA